MSNDDAEGVLCSLAPLMQIKDRHFDLRSPPVFPSLSRGLLVSSLRGSQVEYSDCSARIGCQIWSPPPPPIDESIRHASCVELDHHERMIDHLLHALRLLHTNSWQKKSGPQRRAQGQGFIRVRSSLRSDHSALGRSRTHMQSQSTLLLASLLLRCLPHTSQSFHHCFLQHRCCCC